VKADQIWSFIPPFSLTEKECFRENKFSWENELVHNLKILTTLTADSNFGKAKSVLENIQKIKKFNKSRLVLPQKCIFFGCSLYKKKMNTKLLQKF